MQHSVENSRANTRHLPRTKLAAARSAAANFARRLCRVFARGFAKLRVNFQASVAIICPTTVCAPSSGNDLPDRTTKISGKPRSGQPNERDIMVADTDNSTVKFLHISPYFSFFGALILQLLRLVILQQC